MIPKFNKLCKNFAFELILAEESNHHPDHNDVNINVIILHYESNAVFLFIIYSLIWGSCTILYEKPLSVTKCIFLE